MPDRSSAPAPLHALATEDEADISEEVVGLLTQHQRILFAFIFALLPDKNDAEEVLQRSTVVLWRKREGFELGTSFRSWAFSVARWEVRAFLKERERRSWLVFDDEVTTLLADRMASIPGPGLSERADALKACLSELGSEHRQLIIERYENSLDYHECSKVLGRSEGGLRVTLHRLRTTLRKCIVRRLEASQ